MRLIVLGSSSKGNCYILENDSEALILEAGVKFAEVQCALNFNVGKIAGCLITHEHGDHAGYVNEFLHNAVNVRASVGTVRRLKVRGCRLPMLLEAGHISQIGEFKIIPFEVEHDAAEPLGFYINHPECGNVLFATDTCAIDRRFIRMNNILIECNFSESILDKNTASGRITAVQRKRTLESHLSFEKCLQFLNNNDLSRVNNIVLIHLSDTNSHAEGFRNEIAAATGKTVHVAEKGMRLNFNKTPF
jgi:phosphoribosyl 1,2-cyclic phosphodiesterase